MPIFSTFSAGSTTALGKIRKRAIAVAIDLYAKYVTLLLNGDGTNNAQNNTFVDSSSNNLTVTRYGNATQGSFSPFSQPDGYWGNYFNGSSYLTEPNAAWMNLGTGNFTIECWVQFSSSVGTTQMFVSNNYNAGNGVGGWAFLYRADNTTLKFTCNSNVSYEKTWSPSVGVIYHVAVCRSGTDLRLFVDGVQVGTTSTSSDNISDASSTLVVGSNVSNPYPINGVISNLRIVTSALYTANFTPSTSPLTVVSGTQILTCQSNRFIDNSVNNATITTSGFPSVQLFSPFNPTAAYSAATNGGSMYNSAVGDGVRFINSTSQFGISGDYTIEFWFYPTAAIGDYNILFVFSNLNDRVEYASGNGSQYLLYNSAYNLFWLNNGAGGNGFNANMGFNIVPFQWNHITISRSGADTRCWTNGTLRVSNWSSDMNADRRYLSVATSYAGLDVASGYMSGFRLVNGTAVYSGASNFTPPTTVATNITNTTLLLNFTNAGIYDASGKNTLQTVGDVKISTAQSKFGGSAITFDGTGDYIQVSGTNQIYAFGSGDFTIEFWAYFNATGNMTIYEGRPAVNGAYIRIDYWSGTLRLYASTAVRITGASVSTGQWYHIALCRSGTATKMFLNGTQTGSTYTDSTTYLTGANRPRIGDGDGGGEGFNGVIDDLRITKGYARYVSDFSVSSAPFTIP